MALDALYMQSCGSYAEFLELLHVLRREIPAYQSAQSIALPVTQSCGPIEYLVVDCHGFRMTRRSSRGKRMMKSRMPQEILL